MGCVSPNKAQSTKNFIVDLKFKINYSRKKNHLYSKKYSCYKICLI